MLVQQYTVCRACTLSHNGGKMPTSRRKPPYRHILLVCGWRRIKYSENRAHWDVEAEWYWCWWSDSVVVQVCIVNCQVVFTLHWVRLNSGWPDWPRCVNGIWTSEIACTRFYFSSLLSILIRVHWGIWHQIFWSIRHVTKPLSDRFRIAYSEHSTWLEFSACTRVLIDRPTYRTISFPANWTMK